LGDWANAASAATNLGELEAALGQLTAAVDHLRQAVDLVDRNGRSFPNSQIAEFLQIACRAGLAYSLHQAGQEDGAWDYFREAEALQTAFQPSYPFLRLWKGFVFCDFILGQTERAGWKCCLSANTLDCADEHFHSGFSLDSRTAAQLLSAVEEVEERAASALHISTQLKNVVAIGLDHLSLGRTYLFMAIHSASSSSRAYYLRVAREELDSALAHLRRGGTADYIPLAFLSRAWARSLACDIIGAREDLDDAWDIGERGSMRLHLADIHLHRARLFFREKPYPWKSSQEDLAAAGKLIHDCGYHRRDEELADAKKAILGQALM
jgi:tetratricopeptide (TPR) repeat protein